MNVQDKKEWEVTPESDKSDSHTASSMTLWKSNGIVILAAPADVHYKSP